MTTNVLRARRDVERLRWPARGEAVARPLAVVLLALSAVVLAGWAADDPRLTAIVPGAISMKANTALAFSVFAASFLVTNTAVRRLLLGVVGVIAALVVLQYTFEVNFGIDEMLFADDHGAQFGAPGRMRRTTTLCLLLLAAGGLASTWGRRVLADLSAAVALTIGLVSLYGYAYNLTAFYEVTPQATMSVPAAVAIVLASVLLLISVPGGTLQWIAFGSDPGAALQRLLVPVAVVLLPLGGLIPVQGELRGLYDLNVGVSLLVGFAAVMLLVIGFLGARVAVRIDLERERLVDELGHVNRDLEDRVRVRSVQLNRQRTKLALLEERDRIARDLHDRVIQRIFAAGLQIGALSRTASKQAAGGEGTPVLNLGESLSSVAAELDLAIRELRNSIFELTSISDHDDVEQVVRDIVTRASRILGFMPKIEVRGDVDGLQPDVVANIASVIQEALSNVARHARATEAEVCVTAGADRISIQVADDGVGMPDPLPRSSGVSNLLGRARALGGSATWTSREPRGTLMEWEVPRGLDFGAADRMRPAATYGNTTPVADSDTRHSDAASARS